MSVKILLNAHYAQRKWNLKSLRTHGKMLKYLLSGKNVKDVKDSLASLKK